MQLEVAVPGGTVRGQEIEGVARFLGIPYAAAPFGAHRFAAPAPVVPWVGVRAADAYGPTVPKPPYPSPIDQLLPEPVIEGTECLNLNVWTPDTAAVGLPVLVWIHGGAFVNGSGAVPEYDGSAFARDGVVTVTINYRLGIEGFLHIEDEGPANLALRDQIAALTWVRDTIAAFGGDPAAVTVAGESAGAMSIGALLASPLASGLFRSAIMQSGSPFFAIAAATAERITAMVAAKAGVEPTREALAGVAPEVLLAAQVAVAEEAQGIPDPAVWGEVAANRMAFEPIIGDEVLPVAPMAAIAAGSSSGIPILTGSNLDEFSLFMVPAGLTDFVDEGLLGLAAAGYGLTAEAVDAYRQPGWSPGQILMDLIGDWVFRIPAIRLAEARPDPTYMYDFRWPSSAYDGRLGACHALEIPFAFDTLGRGSGLSSDDAPAGLAEEMHAVWVQFVTKGEPGWAAYTPIDRTVRVFGGNSNAGVSEGAVESDPRGGRRAVWEGVR